MKSKEDNKETKKLQEVACDLSSINATHLRYSLQISPKSGEIMSHWSVMWWVCRPYWYVQSKIGIGADTLDLEEISAQRAEINEASGHGRLSMI